MQSNPHTNDPLYTRNMVMTFLVVAIFMGAWYYFYQMPHQKAMQAVEAKMRQEQALKDAEFKKIQAEHGGTIPEGTTIGQGAIIETKPRADVLATTNRIKISTASLHGSIDLTGARLDDVTLAAYKETLAKNSPEVVLLTPPGTEHAEFIETGWVSSDASIPAPDAKTVWQADSGQTLTPSTPVTLTWDNGKGFKFITKYSIDENYMFSVDQQIQNGTSVKANFLPYALISMAEPKTKSPAPGITIGPIGVVDGTLQKIDYTKLREKQKIEFENSTGWMGITDKYWAKALVPPVNESHKTSFRYSLDGDLERFQADYMGTERAVAPGQTISYNSKVFAGAKELKVLDKYSNIYSIPLFDRLIDFNVLYFLSKPMMKALIYFYSLIGNFGLSILLLTFCVKLLLFPLARKSYISMGRIRDLSPKIQKLREQYKDDKMELNRRTMELYKTEKVNPASGCLPLLLQIPIFLALYKVFYISIEMRHAAFFGWIKDLSAQDPTSILNLFGALPFDPKIYANMFEVAGYHPLASLMIGVWPCLWACTMYIQQKLQPPMADPAQARMMKFLPLVLVVLFATMPAGLVIYWTFSNCLTIFQQLYFIKHHGQRKS